MPRPSNEPPPSVPFRAVALPSEHGGWGLLGEPVVLGLALAATAAGALLALAAFFGFLARQPTRLALIDHRKGSRYPRTALAERVAAGFLLAGVLFLAGAAALARAPFWPALAVAAPFALVALAADAVGRSREASAEAAGAVALSASTAAIAMAGGLPWPIAFAASSLLALRAITSVLYVRARIRLDRGMPAGPGAAVGVHVGALAIAAILARAGIAPWLGVAAFLVLLARAVVGLSSRRAPIRPQRLGFQELAYGLLTLALLAVGYRAGI